MKIRLDAYLVNNGLVSGRDLAKSLIMEGKVFVNGQRADKAGEQIREKDSVELRGLPMPYVSRGGFKLEKALKSFPIDLRGACAMDIGASTGGFTDCMLQNGARRVYAVDVGYGQLAWKLRTDERVVNMERTNIRFVSQEDIDEPLDFVSVDASFISLKLILPVAFKLLKEGGCAVALIKPQFEAGREQVGKKGVVRDKEVHKNVVKSIVEFSEETGFEAAGIDFSPIKGPEGNIEYLIYLKKTGGHLKNDLSEKIAEVVETSHEKAK